MIKVITLTIPSADEMKSLSIMGAEKARAEYEAYCSEMATRGEAYIPEFVSKVLKDIQKTARKGNRELVLNIVDENFSNISSLDPRVNYRYDGWFTRKVANTIIDIFKSCGYRISVETFCRTWNCYRSAEIKISW
jgi:hypothetical protein